MPSAMLRLYKKVKCLIITVLFVLTMICVEKLLRVNYNVERMFMSKKGKVLKFQSFANQRKTYGTQERHQTFSDGYEIAGRLNRRCTFDKNQSVSSKDVKLSMVYETTGRGIQLCPIWKAGSTFLKRLFLMKNFEKYRNISTPFNISFLTKYEPKEGFISTSLRTKRFVFVRNPYYRLLSSYIDKLYAPNPVYWRIIGTRAVRLFRPNASQTSLQCGHDLTFREYVKYVIIALTSGSVYTAIPDLHFQPMTKICKPCEANYDFVGKIETFTPDIFELTKQMNISGLHEQLAGKMDELAAEDAIKDTMSQPFDEVFRNGYIGCISFGNALKRAWTKLQMRGLIGEKALNISDAEEDEITTEQLVDLARKARRESSSVDRLKVKKKHVERFFSSISIRDLELLRSLYADDFRLFDYSDKLGYGWD